MWSLEPAPSGTHVFRTMTCRAQKKPKFETSSSSCKWQRESHCPRVWASDRIWNVPLKHACGLLDIGRLADFLPVPGLDLKVASHRPGRPPPPRRITTRTSQTNQGTWRHCWHHPTRVYANSLCQTTHTMVMLSVLPASMAMSTSFAQTCCASQGSARGLEPACWIDGLTDKCRSVLSKISSAASTASWCVTTSQSPSHAMMRNLHQDFTLASV